MPPPQVRITDPAMYQSIVDAEWQIIYEKLDNCVKCGAQIILSKLPIGDLATQAKPLASPLSSYRLAGRCAS